jgi:hypothetical protein
MIHRPTLPHSLDGEALRKFATGFGNERICRCGGPPLRIRRRESR